MKLSDLVKVKEGYELLLIDKVSSLKGCFVVSNGLEPLNSIDTIIDRISYLDRLILSTYVNTSVNETETLYDLFTYVKSLEKKIEVLKTILEEELKYLVSKNKFVPDYGKEVNNSISIYERLITTVNSEIEKISSKTEVDFSF